MSDPNQSLNSYYTTKDIQSSYVNQKSHDINDIKPDNKLVVKKQNKSSQKAKRIYISKVFYARSYLLDPRWTERLMRLQKEALHDQYQIACLSTLGGAYHLTNNPQKALVIAAEQLKLAKRLGSLIISIRARLYQYVNLSLLGSRDKANEILLQARGDATNSCCQNSRSLLALCDATQLWVHNNTQNIYTTSEIIIEDL